MKIGHLKLRETTTADLIAEVCMLVMTAVYTCQALYNVCRSGLRVHFRVGWNWLDMINYILMFAAFGFRYAAILNGSDIAFPPKDSDVIHMSSVASQILTYKYLMGFNCILTWLRVFKILGHIPFMARLINILSASTGDVISFMLCAAVIVMGYTGALHLTYGTHLKEWQTWSESMMSLYRITNGEWDYDAMVAYQPTIGIFYWCPPLPPCECPPLCQCLHAQPSSQAFRPKRSLSPSG
jgi:hypothetical protein